MRSGGWGSEVMDGDGEKCKEMERDEKSRAELQIDGEGRKATEAGG